MEITSSAALWFLPFALPLCAYTIYTDLAFMRITNVTVIALAAVFVLIGPIALPFDSYLWHLLAMVVALVVGIFMNAGGLMGKLAPQWVSWHEAKKFPMGLALGTVLAAYLMLGAYFGA